MPSEPAQGEKRRIPNWIGALGCVGIVLLPAGLVVGHGMISGIGLILLCLGALLAIPYNKKGVTKLEDVVIVTVILGLLCYMVYRTFR